ncbi:MAG: hypothetical protein J6Z03_05155 [Erysipelotrichaceae bacterium]|nr:hypothetical protein [Erysipelotrichaceae bacterium]
MENIKVIKETDEGFEDTLLYRAYLDLRKCWKADTCAPRMRDDWSEDDVTLGQCSITSFLIQDEYGGEVYGVELGDGNYHCFNLINGIAYDITSGQFKNDLHYDLDHPQSREVHFSKKEKYERYLLLKERYERMKKTEKG